MNLLQTCNNKQNSKKLILHNTTYKIFLNILHYKVIIFFFKVNEHLFSSEVGFVLGISKFGVPVSVK